MRFTKAPRTVPELVDHLVGIGLPAWSRPVLGPPDKLFFTLTLLAAFVGVLSDGSGWAHRFRHLLDKRYPDVPKSPMGMKDGWEDHEIWAERLGRAS